MDYKQAYEKWCNDPYFDEATREELKSLAGDEKEIVSTGHLSLVQPDFAV